MPEEVGKQSNITTETSESKDNNPHATHEVKSCPETQPCSASTTIPTQSQAPMMESDETKEATRLLLKALVWLGSDSSIQYVTYGSLAQHLQLTGDESRQRRLAT